MSVEFLAYVTYVALNGNRVKYAYVWNEFSECYTLQTAVEPTLIPRWPTVRRVAYTVVRLVTLDCTGGKRQLQSRFKTLCLINRII